MLFQTTATGVAFLRITLYSGLGKVKSL